MEFTFINKLSTPAEIREQSPLAPELAKVKHARDKEIRRVSTDESGKFVVVIDPCLVGNREFIYDYVGHLVKIQEKAKDKLIIIPRVYTNKPRTTDEGYMGMIHQPDPEKRLDVFEGILAIHHMYMGVLWETDFFTTDEVLYPENMNYSSGMISYVAVGARSVENQFHRLVANGYDVPVGMKNPTNGSLTIMLNFVVAAQLPHDFIFRDFEVQCPGDPLTCTILRGTTNKRGQCNPDYHYEDSELLFGLYNRHGLQNPVCIVDTNHANSNKQYHKQVHIAREILHNRRHSDNIKNLVKGFTIRSYIKPGNQKVGEHYCGRSIIDSCLGWDDTK